MPSGFNWPRSLASGSGTSPAPDSRLRWTDEITKTELYQKHGVRECRTLRTADRLITVRILSGKEFGPPVFVEARGRVPVKVLDGFAFDMVAVYNQIAGFLTEEV